MKREKTQKLPVVCLGFAVLLREVLPLFFEEKRKNSMFSQSDGTKQMHRGMMAAPMAITRLVNS